MVLLIAVFIAVGIFTVGQRLGIVGSSKPLLSECPRTPPSVAEVTSAIKSHASSLSGSIANPTMDTYNIMELQIRALADERPVLDSLIAGFSGDCSAPKFTMLLTQLQTSLVQLSKERAPQTVSLESGKGLVEMFAYLQGTRSEVGGVLSAIERIDTYYSQNADSTVG